MPRQSLRIPRRRCRCASQPRRRSAPKSLGRRLYDLILLNVVLLWLLLLLLFLLLPEPRTACNGFDARDLGVNLYDPLLLFGIVNDVAVLARITRREARSPVIADANRSRRR